MSDIKNILASTHGWGKLMLPSGKFFIEVRNNQVFDTADGSTRVPIFSVLQTTPCIDSLAKMVATKSHRVWVLDANNQIVGLVGLTNVLKLALKE